MSDFYLKEMNCNNHKFGGKFQRTPKYDLTANGNFNEFNPTVLKLVSSISKYI